MNQRKIMKTFRRCTPTERRELLQPLVEKAPEEIWEIARDLRKELRIIYPYTMVSEKSIVEMLTLMGLHLAAGTLPTQKERI
ncbi:hypothetical protein ADN00_18835 [Ornatilinea apprima]|uniref:Uncharacterized protein n=1 Tax=Ornatilinea apprima TaxID=1134406 RepID=A0A0P6XG92_9CHLR|nr:hypothetical protein [Ornatilinea apprima]KPL70100.1 hypothetical protein ADN00_18835 [Ornatilinea apprima]